MGITETTAPDMVLMSVRIPRKLHGEIKILAVRKDKKLQELVCEVLEQLAKQGRKTA